MPFSNWLKQMSGHLVMWLNKMEASNIYKVLFANKCNLYSGGSKGAPPTDQDFLNFMRFWENLTILDVGTPRGLAPPPTRNPVPAPVVHIINLKSHIFSMIYRYNILQNCKSVNHLKGFAMLQDIIGLIMKKTCDFGSLTNACLPDWMNPVLVFDLGWTPFWAAINVFEHCALFTHWEALEVFGIKTSMLFMLFSHFIYI